MTIASLYISPDSAVALKILFIYNALMINNQKPHSGFIHIFLILVIVAAFIGGAGFFVFKYQDSINGSGSFSSVKKSDDCDDSDRVTLTHLPMNIKDVASVTPYGLIAGAHVTPIDHLYFYPKDGPRDKYPVYVMADGEITSIGVRGVNVSTGESRPPEYRLEIKHSCHTSTYFDLITKLDQSVIDVAPKAATSGFNGSIKVKSGQIIGWIGGQSLDTAVYNSTLVLNGFIHPKMYESEPWKVHTDDFFSYFEEPLRGQMLDLNPRTTEPRSGKIDYDQPGKLIGNWFVKGTNGYAGPKDMQNSAGSNNKGYWSTHLAVFYDAILTDTIILSFGEYDNQGPMPFAVKNNSPRPEDIGVSSGVVKYELITAPNPLAPTQPSYQDTSVRGVALFEVLDGEKLKVEVFPDKTASQVSGFTNDFITYER